MNDFKYQKQYQKHKIFMFRSPVSAFSPHNSMATGGSSGEKETPIHDSDENHDNDVVYPSARLGAMTRKRLQISTFLESGPIDVNKLMELNDEFNQKISNFQHACNSEFSKENLPDYVVSDFRSWYNQHLEVNKKFEKHVEKLIEKASKGDPLQKSDLN